MTLPYEELTSKIIEACFEVSNELGAGFLESVYSKALAIVLVEKGLKVQSEVPLSVYFRGKVIGQYYADLLVDETVIVELKAVSAISAEHRHKLSITLKRQASRSVSWSTLVDPKLKSSDCINNS
jgi:GxxExxY protein